MDKRTSPDFIEALARGLEVIRAFDGVTSLSLTEVAQRTDLARPTARRILITLDALGYVRSQDGRFELTARVLELGVSVYSGSDPWTMAVPRLRELVQQTHESSSLAVLDGSDIVYVARVAVPKLVALSVSIGTRFPAAQTSLGKVLLAGMAPEDVVETLAAESRSGIMPVTVPAPEELAEELARVRDQGWAVADQELAPAIRSVAVPVRSPDGRVLAAMNVNAHAAETSLEKLRSEHLPHLMRAAADLGVDYALRARVPDETVSA
ncbi:Transcriptional regulator, IclR family [Actinomycetales bacterium JB111]|nr:Transcriptional regulator, IclR family [Actinomycetales bacterium JB111]